MRHLSQTIVSVLASVCLTLGQVTAIHAGEQPVVSEPPVFVPPVFVPPSIYGEQSRVLGTGGQAQGAAGTQAAGGAVSVAGGGGQASQSMTAQITRQITDAGRFCARVEIVEYRIDCLSERLQQVAQSMPATGDYAEARVAIENGWRKLNRVAENYRSAERRPARLRSTGTEQETTTRPVTPVDSAQLEQATAQATAVLEEVETVLLRSSSGSRERQVAYQQMAEAIDSNKVLLRSS